jgi:L-malate glycosyltransferase
MKILQVGPNSVHVTRFINAFQQEGVEHYLLSEEPNTEAKVVEQFVLNVHSLNPLKFMGYFSVIRQIFSLIKPDLIHLHQVNRMAYIVTKVAAKHGIPVITTAWGSDVLLMPQKYKLFRFLVRKTIDRSVFVTADATQMITAMNLLIPSSTKYHWLQYGIEPVESGIKENIIYSNRLHQPLYRIDAIINYFAAFHTTHPDWVLHIGATGAETDALKKQVEALKLEKQVVFLGWLDDATNRSEYAKARMYVSLPTSDGTSVSLMEAMSAGCIPVVSDLPANNEWIVNGENGVVEVVGQNPFEQALRLNPTNVSERNRFLIEEKATRKASIAKFEALYELAVNGK